MHHIAGGQRLFWKMDHSEHQFLQLLIFGEILVRSFIFCYFGLL
ncbi:hypothetical protein Plhal703r1_c21g0093341 [Plasmopara halstedii]